MSQYNQNWDDLGKSIQDIVDQAVNSRDYQKLNQTIRQTVDKAVNAGSKAVRNAVNGTPSSSAASSDRTVKQGTVVEKKNLPVLYGSTGGKQAGGVLKIVGGGILSFFTAGGLLSAAAVGAMFGGVSLLSFPGIVALAGLCAGVGLIYSGTATLGKIKRFNSYRRVLGQKTHATLEKLARSVGKSVKFVRKELQSMIHEGLFLEGHIDREGTCLITSDETYQYYEQSRLQLEERKREEAAAKEKMSAFTPQVQEVLDRGNAFIAEIRRCNDDIPGEEISGKIDRMEMIVRRIFQRLQSNPEIVSDLKKLMDYYLPMTVKLLNAYADMDAQPIQGETIRASKREIEATLDTLNQAYEKLLDSVYEDTAMDISSDISVLHTLLAQEGLTEDHLSQMKKQQKNNS